MKTKENIMMEHCSDNGLLSMAMGKSILKAMEEYAEQQVNNLHGVSNNEERVPINCLTCEYRDSNYVHSPCDPCMEFSMWKRQLTDC